MLSIYVFCNFQYAKCYPYSIAKMWTAHFLTTTALSLFLCRASCTVDGREVVVARTGPSCLKFARNSVVESNQISRIFCLSWYLLQSVLEDELGMLAPLTGVPAVKQDIDILRHSSSLKKMNTQKRCLNECFWLVDVNGGIWKLAMHIIVVPQVLVLLHMLSNLRGVYPGHEILQRPEISFCPTQKGWCYELCWRATLKSVDKRWSIRILWNKIINTLAPDMQGLTQCQGQLLRGLAQQAERIKGQVT